MTGLTFFKITNFSLCMLRAFKYYKNYVHVNQNILFVISLLFTSAVLCRAGLQNNEFSTRSKLLSHSADYNLTLFTAHILEGLDYANVGTFL